jgi:hypothetical protein
MLFITERHSSHDNQPAPSADAGQRGFCSVADENGRRCASTSKNFKVPRPRHTACRRGTAGNGRNGNGETSQTNVKQRNRQPPPTHYFLDDADAMPITLLFPFLRLTAMRDADAYARPCRLSPRLPPCPFFASLFTRSRAAVTAPCGALNVQQQAASANSALRQRVMQ